MSIITRMQRQTAVYWALEHNESGGVAYDDYGQPQYIDPVEISCRWSDKIVQFIDFNGSEQVSKSKVFVDRDMVASEVLMLSELVDVTNLSNPKENDGAWEIRGFNSVPNFKATEFLRTAFL